MPVICQDAYILFQVVFDNLYTFCLYSILVTLLLSFSQLLNFLNIQSNMMNSLYLYYYSLLKFIYYNIDQTYKVNFAHAYKNIFMELFCLSRCSDFRLFTFALWVSSTLLFSQYMHLPSFLRTHAASACAALPSRPNYIVLQILG